MSETIYQIPSIDEEWIWNKTVSLENIDSKDTELVSQMVDRGGWEFIGDYKDGDLIDVLDLNRILIKELFLMFLNSNKVVVGIIDPALNPDFILQVEAKVNTSQPVDLKLLNSDGRTNCANCNSSIVEPYPSIRYCPVCEG